jgi:outer membrane receptor protein involved in Fe transport
VQTRFTRKALSVALAALCSSTATPLFASEVKSLVLEEVIVSATKRDEAMNDVALSVSVLDGTQISTMGQRSLADAVATVPNVSFSTSSNGNTLTIRGVGSPALTNVQSSVATFIDGVYVTKSNNAGAPLFDMQQVEVLRGPQGSLFGKNSIAGVFNLVTAKPQEEFSGLVDLRAGNYSSNEGTLVLSGGLVDNVAGRIAIFNRRTGDYLENDLGQGDAGGSKSEAYRASLAWTPSDNTEVNFKYEHFYKRNNNALYQMIHLDPNDVAPLQAAGVDTSKLDTKLDDHMAAGLGSYYGTDFGLSPGFYARTGTTTLTLGVTHTFDNEYEWSTTIGDTHSDFYNKYASTDYPIVGVWQDSNVYSTSQSIETHLTSPVQDQFRFTVGAYADKGRDITNHGYSQANFEYAIGSKLPPPYDALAPQLSPLLQVIIPGDNSNPSYTTSYAVYGEGTYEFDDQWSVTVGARGALDKRHLKQDYSSRTDLTGAPLGATSATIGGILQNSVGVLLPSDPPYDEREMDKAFLPAGKIEFRPDVDSLYYFSVQSGYKNGGFNTATFGAPTTFDKERSVAMEFGGKFAVADGRGQLNFALFQTKFDDLQVGVVDPVTGAVNFDNAAKATSRGIELDTNWRLTETVTVGASYGYLDSTYDSFENAQSDIDKQLVGIKTQDNSGKRLQRAPLNSASAFVTYIQPLTGSLELQANAQLKYNDTYYTDLADSSQLIGDEAVVVDARVALVDTEQLWTLALIGNNLTDDDGMVGGNTASGLTQSPGTYFGQMRQPMTYWVQLEKKF